MRDFSLFSVTPSSFVSVRDRLHIEIPRHSRRCIWREIVIITYFQITLHSLFVSVFRASSEQALECLSSTLFSRRKRRCCSSGAAEALDEAAALGTAETEDEALFG